MMSALLIDKPNNMDQVHSPEDGIKGRGGNTAHVGAYIDCSKVISDPMTTSTLEISMSGSN